MKKITLIALTLALACGLMLGTMGTAMASTTGSGEGRGLFGTVESANIDDSGVGKITLSDVRQGSSDDNVMKVEVKVTAATVYHIPTVTVVQRWQTWAQLTDESRELVREANRVAVLLADPASDLIAQKVMVVPARGICRYRHQLGMVTSVEGDTATIVTRKGEEVTMTGAEGMDLEVGQVVVVVTEKSTGEVQYRAVHAYRWQNMVQRFEGYLNGSLDQASFDNATAMLQQAHERHIRALEALQTRLQERNRTEAAERVGQAIDYAEARYAEAMQLRSEIQARVQQIGWDAWAAQWGEASGTIASINTQTRTMTLNTDNGTLTLQVAAGAVITKQGNVYAFRALKPGDVVGKVLYHMNGSTCKAWYIELQ